MQMHVEKGCSNFFSRPYRLPDCMEIRIGHRDVEIADVHIFFQMDGEIQAERVRNAPQMLRLGCIAGYDGMAYRRQIHIELNKGKP